MIGGPALLAAMSVGIGAALPPLDCTGVRPELDRDPTTMILAGNYPDGLGGCIVWLNLDTFAAFGGTRADACKLGMHEAGHLAGLQHSLDPSDVMFSPYRANPYPRVCLRYVPKRHARRARR